MNQERQADRATAKNATYQNKPVTIVRDATQGDHGFNPQGGDQVLVEVDGTQKVVPRADIVNGR